MPPFVKVFEKEDRIFNINSEPEFEALALEVFAFQHQNNKVYRQWVEALKVDAGQIRSYRKIPFLPIEFFKYHDVLSAALQAESLKFRSSGTVSSVPSYHQVVSPSLYEKSFLKGFERMYGDPANYCILALLPNYLERGDSSLVYMVNRLINESGHPLSGFFMQDKGRLLKAIDSLKQSGQKTLLIGVSYALLDLCEKVKLTDQFIVMETGGMKGKRKEMLKPELHGELKNGFGVSGIHSEYGMTELLSQAYSKRDGLFEHPPWMKFLIREVTDPLSIRTDHKTGGLNVIDLANVYSCSFIATQDLGRLHSNGRLELMGRFDYSDIRGCNLMAET